MRKQYYRFSDFCASLVSGCIIANLVSLGFTAGSWVTVTAVTIADPKPMVGLTSASWGYPLDARVHIEARSRPSHGHASVCLKHQSRLTTFNQAIYQDIIWQLLVGIITVLVLCYKFALRSALGFCKFNPPAIGDSGPVLLVLA